MCFMCCLFCFFCLVLSLFFFFFFSSRRRHTRFSRDWSSDVCSSDLRHAGLARIEAERLGARQRVRQPKRARRIVARAPAAIYAVRIRRKRGYAACTLKREPERQRIFLIAAAASRARRVLDRDGCLAARENDAALA